MSYLPRSRSYPPPPLSRGPDRISKGVCRYSGQLVYDRQLLSFLGLETYTRLQRNHPSLWIYFHEQSVIPLHPGATEALLAEHALVPEEAKRQLVAAYLKEEPSSLAAVLVGSSSPPPNAFYRSTWTKEAIWIIWVVVMVIAVVWYVVNSRLLYHLLPSSGSLLENLILAE